MVSCEIPLYRHIAGKPSLTVLPWLALEAFCLFNDPRGSFRIPGWSPLSYLTVRWCCNIFSPSHATAHGVVPKNWPPPFSRYTSSDGQLS